MAGGRCHERSIVAERGADALDRGAFSVVAWSSRVDDRRILSGCAVGLWAAQVDLQPIRPLEPARGFRPHLRRRKGRDGVLMIDATHIRAHRTAASFVKKRSSTPCDRTQPRRPDRQAARPVRRPGRSLRLLLTEAQRNDHLGARALAPDPPEAAVLLADRAYDSHWFR